MCRYSLLIKYKYKNQEKLHTLAKFSHIKTEYAISKGIKYSGSVWGMIRGVGRVRKSIDQS